MSKTIFKLEGEQLTFGGSLLFIDLIPRNCWFSSIRLSLIKSDWERVRKYAFQRAGNKCQCCQSSEKLEAHERWDQIEQSQTQKLMRIVALCQKCHLVTHFGRAQMIGYEDQAKQHLMKVDAHIRQAFELWRQRNKTQWKLDLDIIPQSGLRFSKKTHQNIEKEKKLKEPILKQ